MEESILKTYECLKVVEFHEHCIGMVCKYPFGKWFRSSYRARKKHYLIVNSSNLVLDF